jgi:alkanesulfonate monooxygenase SsuD/methylene tetrahydromethanopterin reductase-like flavin-dependent oxidoreductase (luciferase family)
MPLPTQEAAMDVGLQMVFSSYGWSDVSDQQVWDEEPRLARLAADLGFDVLWSVEHHFNDYSFCPDNLQLMTHLADVCPTVGIGTAAVILPWHDPLRVAEQVSVLDHLSGGRLRLGMGRGLARREFETFRGQMDESRERFDEAAAMILAALRTGVMEDRRALVGDFELATSFRFGGTPYDFAERGLRLYAKEVLPVIKAWAHDATARAAE